MNAATEQRPPSNLGFGRFVVVVGHEEEDNVAANGGHHQRVGAAGVDNGLSVSHYSNWKLSLREGVVN